MRVVYLTTAAAIGGGNRSLLTLWAGLRDTGITPLAVCPEDGPMVQACRDQGVACEVVEYRQPEWKNPLATWRALRTWRRLLRGLKADLVHANDPISARSVCLASWVLGLPLVSHVRFPTDAAGARWLFRGLPRPRTFVFNSQALRQEMAEPFAAACPKTTQEVIHNAVELDQFTPQPAPAGEPRRIALIANLSPIKGIEDFLAMAREVLGRGHRCQFWIVGEEISRSGYRERLEALAVELGLAEAARFLGYRADVADVLGQVDVVVCSSHYETFGRTAVEAMACARPVVATAVGGIPEVVDDGKTGLLVPPRDPAALATAVCRLLDDRDLCQAFGKAGRERAVALFGKEAHVARMVRLYEELMTGKRSPA